MTPRTIDEAISNALNEVWPPGEQTFFPTDSLAVQKVKAHVIKYLSEKFKAAAAGDKSLNDLWLDVTGKS